ncbi:MAG: hypothetical protein V3R73_05815 [Sphingomonadales bacterium]
MKRALKIIAGLLGVLGLGLAILLNHHLIFEPESGALACQTRLLRISNGGGLVEGPEDIVIDRARGVAYISAYDRFSVEREVEAGGPVLTRGGIFQLNLDQLGSGKEELEVRDITADFSATNQFRPHGLGLYLEAGRGRALFAVNRRHVVEGGEVRLTPTVEIFDLEGEEIDDLGEPVLTVSDALMCGPNDIAPLDARSFLVSNDHGACDPSDQFIEELLGWKDAYLLYFAGGPPKVVARGLGYPNGITLTPETGDGQKLLVAATREKAVYVFDLQALLQDPPGSLNTLPEYSIPLPGSPDNFSWDAEGRLYLAVFPNIYRFAAFRGGWFGIKTAPGGFLELDWKSPEKPSYAHVFDGDVMNGATVATPYGDWLLAASGFDNKLMVCARDETSVAAGAA